MFTVQLGVGEQGQADVAQGSWPWLLLEVMPALMGWGFVNIGAGTSTDIVLRVTDSAVCVDITPKGTILLIR